MLRGGRFAPAVSLLFKNPTPGAAFLSDLQAIGVVVCTCGSQKSETPANWVVKRAVGGTPTILGKKLKQTYHQREHYFEGKQDSHAVASESKRATPLSVAIGTGNIDLIELVAGQEEPEEWFR